MNRTSLILAAHGSRREPAVNAEVSRLAASFSTDDRFYEATAAFHQGEPSFSQAVDRMRTGRIAVVPFLTSNGYFCRNVLPAGLARSARFEDVAITISPPVGEHRVTARLVSSRVRHLLARHGFATEQTTVVVVGHGTKRERYSSFSTMSLASRLRGKRLSAETLTAFLDEPPFVSGLMKRVRTTNVIVIPFFIGQSSHAKLDVPAGLGLQLAEGQSLPVRAMVRGVSIVCDVAVGTYPGIIEAVSALADEAMHEEATQDAASRFPRSRIAARDRVVLTDPNRDREGAEESEYWIHCRTAS